MGSANIGNTTIEHCDLQEIEDNIAPDRITRLAGSEFTKLLPTHVKDRSSMFKLVFGRPPKIEICHDGTLGLGEQSPERKGRRHYSNRKLSSKIQEQPGNQENLR